MSVMGHIWRPVDADNDGLNLQITYRNELGEEFLYSTEYCSFSSRKLCWKHCCGDWPACMAACPAIKLIWEEEEAERKSAKPVQSDDPFNFILNHNCYIDDNNYYVEEFDTLDGAHWEIALDINEQIQRTLDEETDQTEGVDT